MKNKVSTALLLTSLSCLIVFCPPALSRDRQKELLNIQAHQIWAAQHGMYLPGVPGVVPGYTTPYDDQIYNRDLYRRDLYNDPYNYGYGNRYSSGGIVNDLFNGIF